MPNSYFEYNGYDCRTWNCYKTQPINFPTPEKDVERKEVPGRNGDLIIDNGGYKNVEVVIQCYIEGDFIAQFDAMRAALMRDAEYHKLVDSLYPDEYRLASVRNVEAMTKTPKKGTVEITLSCKPYRYTTTDGLARTYNATSFCYALIAFGVAEDVCDSAWISKVGMAGHFVGVIDVSQFIADMAGLGVDTTQKFKIVGYYPYAYREIAYGDSATDPTAGDGGAYSKIERTPITNKVVLFDQYLSAGYLWFDAPAYYEILDESDNVVDRLFPDEFTIANPTNYASKPLIHIHVTGDTPHTPVACVNYSQIYFDATDAVVIGGETYAANDIYIDAETMNAYIMSDGQKLGVNDMVRLDRDIELLPGENAVRINSAINSLEIIPNWVTL